MALLVVYYCTYSNRQILKYTLTQWCTNALQVCVWTQYFEKLQKHGYFFQAPAQSVDDPGRKMNAHMSMLSALRSRLSFTRIWHKKIKQIFFKAIVCFVLVKNILLDYEFWLIHGFTNRCTRNRILSSGLANQQQELRINDRWVKVKSKKHTIHRWDVNDTLVDLTQPSQPTYIYLGCFHSSNRK